ncbi:hypothetical protein [Chitinophaga sp. XS-30]|uniref:hypothetical protein n=1 Tax=Chitinophaga sp. XS-30 TaxID=2604421 RepID=UPI0011DCEF94|nr:hypothetical protein [Chitinophaga sp. XS-30]QEH43160.1 hypothetical protein FW415_20725 [Chitinophaga sp. XS-30]
MPITFIDKNENLISSLSGDLTLLSGALKKIDFYLDEKNELFIDLIVALLYDPEKRIVKLTFSGIREYLFYASHPSIFFYIEDYKFLKNDRGIYLCLDPFWENKLNKVSTQDQNYIVAEQVDGYFIKPDKLT